MIEKISIPDEDMPGWIQTLREGGFTDPEINSILSHLNTVYREVKQKEYVERELQKINIEITKRRGFPLTEAESEKLRVGIESRLEAK